jgi:FkbM family methyltransferase
MLLTKFFARHGYLRKPRDGFSLLKEGWGRKLGLTNAVHVGAHLAEERDVYEALGFSDVLWIEASAEIYQDLVRSLARPTGAKTRHVAVNALASATPGEQLKLRHFSNEGSSNSIFAASPLFREHWPTIKETGVAETVTSDTADRIAAAHGFASADLLLVDVQGAELLVLKGATSLLKSAKAVIVEVSLQPYYEGGVLQPELREFLRGRGFMEIRRPPDHGDQLYIRA